MDSYPPLLGLSLAPRETSAAPEGSDLKKHRVDEYQKRLEEWKSTDTLKERWYEYKKGRDPRKYFEDDPRFYKDWIPVAEQESYFYERRDHEGRLMGVIHPAQTILRVAADSMGISIARLAEFRTWIVDGSNLLDANVSRIKIQDKIKALKNAYPDKYPGDCAIIVCKAEGLSDFKNTQPIKDEKGKELKPERTFEKHYNGFGRHWDWMQYLAPPDKIFLVVVEDWIHHVKFDVDYKGTAYVFDEKKKRKVPKEDQVRTERLCGQDSTEGKKPAFSELQGPIDKERIDKLGFKHYKCEYDDTLCITLRQLLAFHRDAAAADDAAAAAPAAASDSAEGWEEVPESTKKKLQPLGHKTFGKWGPDEHTGDPKLVNEKAWREEPGETWRQSPDVGVVTDDMHMWENLYPEAIARSYEQLLKFSDVFRIRIFMPLGRQGLPPTPPTPTYPKPPPVAAAIEKINTKRKKRYVSTDDSMLSGTLAGFFGNVLSLVNKKAVLFDPKANPGMVLPRVEAAPVNWAFTNQLRKATPPGWGEAQTRSEKQVAKERAAVVKLALGEEMVAKLDTWYKEWTTPSQPPKAAPAPDAEPASASAPAPAPAPAPIAEPLDIVAFLKSLEEKRAAAGPSSES